MIFFSHPIDRASDRLSEMLQGCQHSLASYESLTVFKPGDAWQVQPPHDARVQQINEHALRNSDCVLAYLPANVWTRGVPVEITVANELNIPVVLIIDRDANSVIENYWIKHHNVVAYEPNDYLIAIQHAVQLAKMQSPRVAPLTAKYTGGEMQLTQAHAGDAGFDLAYNGSEPLEIQPGRRVAVPTGVRIEMPPGYYALIVGRSSSFSKRDLLVPLSVIDAGFRGELFAVCKNFGDDVQTIQPNERIAQLLPMKLEANLLQWVNSPLSQSDRGENGFGSSGR